MGSNLAVVQMLHTLENDVKINGDETRKARYFDDIVHDRMFEHRIQFDFFVLQNILVEDKRDRCACQ